MVDRWQQHYDEFIESVKEEGRLSLTTPAAARQYADDMIAEEKFDDDKHCSCWRCVQQRMGFDRLDRHHS